MLSHFNSGWPISRSTQNFQTKTGRVEFFDISRFGWIFSSQEIDRKDWEFIFNLKFFIRLRKYTTKKQIGKRKRFVHVGACLFIDQLNKSQTSLWIFVSDGFVTTHINKNKITMVTSSSWCFILNKYILNPCLCELWLEIKQFNVVQFKGKIHMY